MVPADLYVTLPARTQVPQPELVQQKKVWNTLKDRVGPIAAARGRKTPQFDAARRLNDGLG